MKYDESSLIAQTYKKTWASVATIVGEKTGYIKKTVLVKRRFGSGEMVVNWLKTNGTFPGSVLSGPRSSGAVVCYPQNWETKRALIIRDVQKFLCSGAGVWHGYGGPVSIRIRTIMAIVRWSRIERTGHWAMALIRVVPVPFSSS